MNNAFEPEFSSKDLDLLGKCLARLDSMLERWEKEPTDDAVRDSVVKRFELTYELAVKTLLRYLLWNEPSAAKIANYDFQDLIRRGDQVGILQTGWPEWKKYRLARNKTVHTYREEIAIEVALEARDFAKEAHILLQNLKQRTKADA